MIGAQTPERPVDDRLTRPMNLPARLQAFFGDDWDETLDSLFAAPGALGGLSLTGLRSLKPIDLAALALVVLGWAWIIGGYLIGGNHDTLLLVIAIIPTIGWLLAGLAAGLIFQVAGFGKRSLAYWESYFLVLVFALFGVASLRVALSPRGRRVYRRDRSGAR
jgi:hypothetical protein